MDLLHGLVDFLRSHNTAKQREIILWKYSLLGEKVDMSDPMHALVKARKAIENGMGDHTTRFYKGTRVGWVLDPLLNIQGNLI